MAATSTDAITWTAGRGFDLLLDPHSTHEQIARKWDLYHRVLAEHGHPTDDRTVPMARLVAVARTDAEAEELARAGAAWTLGSYAGRPAGAPPPPDPLMPAPMSSSDPVQRYVDEVIVWGTPQRVIDELRRLEKEMHLGYLLAAPLGHDSFELLTDEVLPAIG
jgi:alkanesulfonate monooxygenase SsuD/methylene tetrahydromethanopterin reductase-like flavin-dependent oxidoreductase (luciferase family)